MGEEAWIMEIGGMFEYQIRFSQPFLVPEIYSAKETSLVSDFCIIGLLTMAQISPSI